MGRAKKSLCDCNANHAVVNFGEFLLTYPLRSTKFKLSSKNACSSRPDLLIPFGHAASIHFHEERVLSRSALANVTEGSTSEEEEAEDVPLSGWDDVDAHLWSEDDAEDENDGNVELVELLTKQLPLMLLSIGIIVFVEMTAVMQRRGRDREIPSAHVRSCRWLVERIYHPFSHAILNHLSAGRSKDFRPVLFGSLY